MRGCWAGVRDFMVVCEEIMIGTESTYIYIYFKIVTLFHFALFVELNEVMCSNSKRDKTVSMLSP